MMDKKLLLLICHFVFLSEDNLIVPFDIKSEVSYVGSHPAHNWTGVSTKFKGGIVCRNLDDCLIKIQIPLDSFDSGSSNRDSNMLYYVESNKYKYVTFHSEPFPINDKALSVGDSINLKGTIDFHGVEKKVLFNASIFAEDEYLRGEANFNVYLSDHKVERPSLLFTPISDLIIIKCNLYCPINQFRSYVEK